MGELTKRRLKKLADGTPPSKVAPIWDCETVIVLMAKELIRLRKILTEQEKRNDRPKLFSNP